MLALEGVKKQPVWEKYGPPCAFVPGRSRPAYVFFCDQQKAASRFAVPQMETSNARQQYVESTRLGG